MNTTSLPANSKDFRLVELKATQWDPYFNWVRNAAKGKSFVDVGGLWGVKGELVTTAAKGGASSCTMVDYMPAHHPLWKSFDDRCAEFGVAGVTKIVADLDAADFVAKVGQRDVVACGGILYHCPNPVHTLTQLASIARDTLIVRSARFPDVISNDKGEITLHQGSALFLPGLEGQDREIVREYYRLRGDTPEMIPVILNDDRRDPWWRDGTYTYGPWWWGFTTSFLVNLFDVLPFKVTEVLVWPYTVGIRAKRV